MRKPSPNITMIFVLATIVIDAMGFGIIMPIAPDLLMEVGHLNLADATAFGTWLSVLFASFQFIFGTIIGNLGDRFGRRPVLLGALGGFAINFFLQAQAQSVVWLLVGQAVAGVFGGTYGPAQAALADVTPPEGRARAFGFVGAAFGIGFVIGPIIGGFLGNLGTRVPFYVASALAAANFVYGLTLFPETLARENRRAFDWRRANPFGALLKIRSVPGVTMLACVLLLWQIASLVYPLTWTYYLKASYGASKALIGFSLGTVGIALALTQILLTGRVVKRWGERTTALFGISMAIWTFLVLAAGPFNPWILVLGMTMPLGNLTQPAIMAMMSRRATASNQGEIQGIAASVMSVGSIIAPFLLTRTLAYYISPAAPIYFPGAAFIAAALCAVCAIAVLNRTPRLAAKVPPAE